MTQQSLQNQVVVITGASRGLGRCLASHLAKEGCRLVLAARNEAQLNEVKAELSTLGCTNVTLCIADVSTAQACQQVIQTALNTYGRLDILINNAGMGGKVALLQEVSDQTISDMIDLNLKAPFWLSKAALQPMVEQQTGTIVNVNSVAGKTAFPFWSVYDATKAGLKALTEALCEEQRSNGIRVMGLYPGAIDTTIWDAIDMANVPSREGMLQVEQVAEAVIYALKQPQHVYVSDITIQPLKPAL